MCYFNIKSNRFLNIYIFQCHLAWKSVLVNNYWWLAIGIPLLVTNYWQTTIGDSVDIMWLLLILLLLLLPLLPCPAGAGVLLRGGGGEAPAGGGGHQGLHLHHPPHQGAALRWNKKSSIETFLPCRGRLGSGAGSSLLPTNAGPPPPPHYPPLPLPCSSYTRHPYISCLTGILLLCTSFTY